MKLQKLMYYICCDYVAKTDKMPINEYFEVWKFGPVLPSVYEEFRQFGSNPITEYAKNASGESYIVSESNNPILSNVIDVIWAKHKNKTGIELSKMIHRKGSGWYRADVNKKEIITLEDMKNNRTGR